MTAEKERATERFHGGPVPRHIDLCTAQLDRLARTWLDVQQTRKAIAQRELPDAIVESFLKAERTLSRELSKELRRHRLWPWISQFPGLGGAHTALIIGRIGDPRRFPGQRCTDGHYFPPLYAAGAPCPLADVPREIDPAHGEGVSDVAAADTRTESEENTGCGGVMLPPREPTGVRSLWHWAGLHAVDGRAPRMRKHVKCDWEPRVRASVMQPGGIAEQIVRLNVPHYGDIYRTKKVRLTLRVTDLSSAIEALDGDADIAERTAEGTSEIVELGGRPLRLFEADRIARKVAAKAFLGDLLVEWKRLA